MDGYVTIGTELDTKSFDSQIKELEKELETLTKTYEDTASFSPFPGQEEDLQSLDIQIEKTQNKLYDLVKKQNAINNINLEDVNSEYEKHSSVISSIIGKVTKWGLALFGVRTAYNIVRRAGQTALNGDDKLTQTMENNWIGLSVLIKPIVEGIVLAIRKAVTGILYFFSILSGQNLIAKANAEAIKQQAAATDKLTKANNKYNASFDEGNIISDNSNKIDTFDKSTLFDINELSENTRKAIEKIANALQPIYDFIKDIVKWAIDNPETVIAILGGLALLSFISKLMGVSGVSGLLGLSGILSTLLTIGAIVIGIYIIGSNIKKVIEQLNDLKKTLNEEKEAWKTNAKESINAFDEVIDAIKKGEGTISGSKNTWINYTAALQNNIKKLKENKFASKEQADAYLVDTMKRIEAMKADFDMTEMTFEQQAEYIGIIKDTIRTLQPYEDRIYSVTGKHSEYYDQINKLNEIYDEVNGNLGGTSKQFQEVGKSTETATNKISNFDWALKGLDSSKVDSANTKFTDLIKKMDGIKSKTIDIDMNDKSFKSGLENLLNNKLRTSMSTIFSTLGMNIHIPTIKLKNGGIINYPGKGVPLRQNVVGGEAGKEGVVPLTDSQAMEELGSSIGRYVTTNVTSVLNVDGRTLARIIKKIIGNSDFAANR